MAEQLDQTATGATRAGRPAFGFDNAYRRLPERFHAAVRPVPVAAPLLLAFNRPLAEELGLDADALLPHAAALFSGNLLPADAEPIALAYAGHQFGGFVPSLGDGRAVLLGDLVDRRGIRRDVQLKGSGITPFSRGGDGRAAIGPVLREYLVAEAMHALGVPTTRALAAVATGERVFRDGFPPGAVLTRVAASHIRVGTFQYFAARRDADAVRTLADHAVARHHPDLADAPDKALGLFRRVLEAQADLVARWMSLGFVHGVMNTDNTSVSGETIDYGPCAFMDAFDPATVFSSIDRQGRYAYGNQPVVMQWNLARFAETLLPLLAPDQDAAVEIANDALSAFPGLYGARFLERFRAKIGLAGEEDGDAELVQALLDAMQAGRADFTLTFRRLADAAADPARMDGVRALSAEPAALDAWAERWAARTARDPRSPAERAAAMKAANPAAVPRNHLVEAALAAAAEHGDLGPFRALHEALARPFDDLPPGSPHREPPPRPDAPYVTFCGT
jgi:uncharacterized protein YdiU (UPF0061 family)